MMVKMDMGKNAGNTTDMPYLKNSHTGDCEPRLIEVINWMMVSMTVIRRAAYF
jgi:hypothetical protein